MNLYRNHINQNNNLVDLNSCKKLLYKKSKFLGKGGQGQVFKIESKECGGIVLKKYYEYTKKEEIKKEIYMLNHVKKLIDNNVCPNFIYMFENGKIDNLEYILMEYADGDIERWFEFEHTDSEIKSFVFQMLVGILSIQKYLKAYHSDLKPKNIFFKKLSDKKNFKYKINNEEYYVPTFGNLFLIADFGHAKSLLVKDDLKIEDKIIDAIAINKDFRHILHISKRLIVTNIMEKGIDTLDKLYNVINNDEYLNKIKKYYGSESDKIKKDFEKYPKYLQDKMLLKNILYYVVENNLIDFSNYKTGKYYVPSDEMTEFMKKIFSSIDPIELIIKNNFSEYVEKTEYSVIFDIEF